MPKVISLPHGGLATELGTLTEAIRSYEAIAREGVSSTFLTVGGSIGSSSFSTIAGWPDVPVAVNAGGVFCISGYQALIPAGSTGGWGITDAVSIDGVVPPSPIPNFGGLTTGSFTFFTVTSATWAATAGVMYIPPSFAPMGLRTFGMQLKTDNYVGSFSVRNPFLVVVPL